MGCTCKRRPQTVDVTLTFKRKNLLYDIGNMGFVEGDVMEHDAPHSKHLVQDIVQDGNVDFITRKLDLAYVAAVEMLYPYSKADVIAGGVKNDELYEMRTYIIELSLPKTFSETTVWLLEELIHEYIVDWALYEWLSVTKPDSAENWREKRDDAERRIRRALLSRSEDMRIKSHPW